VWQDKTNCQDTATFSPLAWGKSLHIEVWFNRVKAGKTKMPMPCLSSPIHHAGQVPSPILGAARVKAGKTKKCGYSRIRSHQSIAGSLSMLDPHPVKPSKIRYSPLMTRL
jgi:hypothetical protein